MFTLAAVLPFGYRLASTTSGTPARHNDLTTPAGAIQDKANQDAARRSFVELPLAFEVNQGQTDPQVDFLSRGAGRTLFLTPTEAVFALSAAQGQPGTGGAGRTEATVALQLVGSNPRAPASTHDALPGRIDYFAGTNPKAWNTNVATFGKVSYAGVYPGIDVVYYGNQSQLEYDFSVSPGADPGVVAFRVNGGDSLRIEESGDLVVSTSAGDLRQAKPVIYQVIGGAKQAVEGGFALRGDRQVGFQIGDYDHSYPLVIDPTLDYSTFLGGSANDFGFGIAVDSAGMVYVGGQTGSTVFPRGGTGTAADPTPKGAAGSFDTTKSGGTDAFVLKFNPAATTTNGDATTSQGALIWAAFLGGSNNDAGYDVALDASGNVYLAGSTVSGNDDPTTAAIEVPFPSTANAFDRTCGTDAAGLCNQPFAGSGLPALPDAFLSKISNDGSTLLYSTFLGGSGEEQNPDEIPYSGFLGLAVKGSSAYLTSLTFSSDFPIRGKAPQSKCVSCSDGLSDSFVSVLDTSQSGANSLTFSTYLGGKATDEGKGIAVDDAGNVYVTGHTFGNAENSQGNPVDNNFPVKAALQTAYRGGYSDAYVSKLNPAAKTTGQALVYSTFLGGGGLDEGWDIALKPGGTEAYVTGYTTSGPNPHGQTEDPAHPGACAAAPNADGVRPFCDYSSDPAPYFPTTTGPAFAGRDSNDSGSALFTDGDAFLVKLTAAGGLAWSRFIGGPSADYGQGLVVDSSGNSYIAGWTTCRNQDPRLEPGDTGFNIARDEPPPQFYVNDPAVPDNDGVDLNGDGIAQPGDSDLNGDGIPDAPRVPEGTPTGRNPGEPAQTGVADCPSAANGYDDSGAFPGPNLNPGEPGAHFGHMDSNNFDNHFNDNPTGVWVAKVADGGALQYAVLIDGFGFDRGFDIAISDSGGQRGVYVTGRMGSCSTSTQTVDGHPVAFRTCTDGAPYPTTAGAYDTTYNGSGRDTVITKLVE